MNRFILTEGSDSYKQHGYADRDTYLKRLAIDFDVDKNRVVSLATLLGPTQDFNELVSDLEDFSEFL